MMGEDDEKRDPRDVSADEVLAAFEAVDAPVGTIRLVAEEVNAYEITVLQHIQMLEAEGKLNRLEVGRGAAVWWPVEDESDSGDSQG